MKEPANVRVGRPLQEGHAGFDVSDERAMKALARAEDSHFWFRARNKFILSRLRTLGVRSAAEILELGCGGGSVSAYLAHRGYRVTGVDGHLSLVCRAARRAPNATFLAHDITAGDGGLAEESYDVVGLFDVIEHLDDPCAALAGALRFARPGGMVVGTVPALMALWSDVDVNAGHVRRYEYDELCQLVSSLPGAQLVEVTDFGRLLVPLLWLQRRAVVRESASATSENNLAVPWWPVNRLLLAAASAERAIFAAVPRSHRSLRIPGSSLWFALRRERR